MYLFFLFGNFGSGSENLGRLKLNGKIVRGQIGIADTGNTDLVLMAEAVCLLALTSAMEIQHFAVTGHGKGDTVRRPVRVHHSQHRKAAGIHNRFCKFPGHFPVFSPHCTHDASIAQGASNGI
jgi:hypothetical protein